MSTRAIHTYIDTSDLGYRLGAECDEERTEHVLMGGPGALAVFGYASEEELVKSLSGDLGRMLVTDHTERCASCRAWAAQGVTA